MATYISHFICLESTIITVLNIRSGCILFLNYLFKSLTTLMAYVLPESFLDYCTSVKHIRKVEVLSNPTYPIEQFGNRTQSNTNRSIAELNRT